MKISMCQKVIAGARVLFFLLIGCLFSLPIFGHFDIKSLKLKEIHSVVLNSVVKVAQSKVIILPSEKGTQ